MRTSEETSTVAYDRLLQSKIKKYFAHDFYQQHCTRSLTLCHQPLDIIFCHPDLEARYFPALQHLEKQADATEPCFSLFVLDITLIQEQHFANLSEFLVDFFKLEQNKPLPSPEHSHFLAFADYAYYYNHQTRWGVWFVDQHQRFTAWHFANPFRYFLYDWLVHQHYQLVHVSAISDQYSTILFAGASGAGKSTTALLGLQAGYALLGDDHCAVSVEKNPRAFSLYNTIKLDETLLKYPFAALQPYVSTYMRTEKMNKALINIADRNKESMHNDSPVSAIICLAIDASAQTATLSPLSKAETLKTLSLTTMEQCAWVSRKQVFANMKTIVENLPCYRLILCPDHHDNLTKIRELFHAWHLHHYPLL